MAPPEPGVVDEHPAIVRVTRSAESAVLLPTESHPGEPDVGFVGNVELGVAPYDAQVARCIPGDAKIVPKEPPRKKAGAPRRKVLNVAHARNARVDAEVVRCNGPATAEAYACGEHIEGTGSRSPVIKRDSDRAIRQQRDRRHEPISGPSIIDSHRRTPVRATVPRARDHDVACQRTT